jgi:hypothetical protein
VTGVQTCALPIFQGALDDKADDIHGHAISDVTGLQTALDSKLDDSQATAFGLSLLNDADAATARTTLGLGTAATSAATAFAPASHSHTIANVTGLQTALDNKLDDSQATAFGLSLLDDANATAARTTLGLGTAATSAATAFAPASHTHTIANVTGLQTALDNKLDDSQASSFGLSLLDDADAATARTTLGLGTAATSATGDFAASSHSHIIADVTGLQAALDAAGGVNPNLLINGDFQINQRVFAGGALAAGVYGFDRWKASTGGANVSRSGYVVTLTSGEIEQIIETPIWGVANFASTEFTVSVDTPSQDMTVTLGSVSGTITAGSGRRSVTLTTGAGDTGNLTLKLKRTAVGAVTFGRVKVELGETATVWQPRDFPTELALCRRYFEKSYSLSVVPGTPSSSGVSALFLFGALPTSVWTPGSVFSFAEKKRVSPTMTVYNPVTGGVGTARDYANSTNVAALIGAYEDAFLWYASASAATSAYNMQLHWTASAEL